MTNNLHEPEAESDQELINRVGERVRSYRKMKDMTLEDLSNASDLHSSSIYQVEHGERNLTLNSLAQLAEGLEVHPFQLVLDDPDNLLRSDEAEEFKIKNMVATSREDLQDLLYHLSKLFLENS